MAEPPQMPVPTPISVRRSRGTPSSRPYSQAAPRQMTRVPSMTGSEDTPTRAASPIDNWAPSSTTEHCSTTVLAHFSPGASRVPGLMAMAMAAPMIAPGTALPTSGTYCPITVAAAATASASARPGAMARARRPGPAAGRRSLRRQSRRRRGQRRGGRRAVAASGGVADVGAAGFRWPASGRPTSGRWCSAVMTVLASPARWPAGRSPALWGYKLPL